PLVSLKDSSPIAVARIVTRPSLITGAGSEVDGRGLALTQSTVQVPSPGDEEEDGVEQLPPIWPPLVVNATVVPSGAGLPNRSASRTVMGTVTPSGF